MVSGWGIAFTGFNWFARVPFFHAVQCPFLTQVVEISQIFFGRTVAGGTDSPAFCCKKHRTLKFFAARQFDVVPAFFFDYFQHIIDGLRIRTGRAQFVAFVGKHYGRAVFGRHIFTV